MSALGPAKPVTPLRFRAHFRAVEQALCTRLGRVWASESGLILHPLVVTGSSGISVSGSLRQPYGQPGLAPRDG